MRAYNLKHGDECEIISQDGDRSRVRFDDGYETETPTAELLDADEHERMVCGQLPPGVPQPDGYIRPGFGN